MTLTIEEFKYVRQAEEYRGETFAAALTRQSDGTIAFEFTDVFIAAGAAAIATSLPVDSSTVVGPAGGLPPFFTGLLPEGHRLRY